MVTFIRTPFNTQLTSTRMLTQAKNDIWLYRFECIFKHARMFVPMFQKSSRILSYAARRYIHQLYSMLGVSPQATPQQIVEKLRLHLSRPLTDKEVLHTQLVYIFPNIQLNLRSDEILVFRHLPHPTDPNQSYFTQYLLRESSSPAPQPKSVDYTASEYGPVTGADLKMIGMVQEGLKMHRGRPLLLTEQEAIIVHMHRTFNALGLQDV